MKGTWTVVLLFMVLLSGCEDIGGDSVFPGRWISGCHQVGEVDEQGRALYVKKVFRFSNGILDEYQYKYSNSSGCGATSKADEEYAVEREGGMLFYKRSKRYQLASGDVVGMFSAGMKMNATAESEEKITSEFTGRYTFVNDDRLCFSYGFKFGDLVFSVDENASTDVDYENCLSRYKYTWSWF